MRPNVREPAMIESPNPKKLTKSDIPNNPKTTDGTPLRLLVMIRIKLIIFPFLAYSFIYMPDMIPIGKLNRQLPITRHNVPTIAGNIPPEVIPSWGAFERKSQLMTPMPFLIMKNRIANKMATIDRLKNLNKIKAIF